MKRFELKRANSIQVMMPIYEVFDNKIQKFVNWDSLKFKRKCIINLNFFENFISDGEFTEIKEQEQSLELKNKLKLPIKI